MITNKHHLAEASDEEIKEFFSRTVFEGVFSKENKTSKDYFSGHIHTITLNMNKTNVIGSYINVPVTANDIPEGPCSFKCRLKQGEIRNSSSQINFFLYPQTLRSLSSNQSNKIITTRKTNEQDLFDMWGVESCECIGYYHYDEKHKIYVVDDLRKPNFDHIPYYPHDRLKRPIRITYPHKIKGISLNDYYIFTWKLSHQNPNNPYEIFIDSNKQPYQIEPKWFIDTLFEDRHNDKSKNFGSATNFLDTLSKQLSAKESTFVYELLQNANDYPVEGRVVDVQFHITDNYLLFMHSGETFNVRNISGICGINEKEKIANKRAIGYKGIGFKTVFLHNHYVYLQTGEYSFRFDEGETPEKKVGGKIKRLGAPFQILPIWTTHNNLASEINTVFDSSDKNFRVRIALRPEDKNLLHVGKNCYENLFKEIFADANIILFIPNINSVKVFINGKKERECFRDSEEWIVADYEEDIPLNLQESINKTIDKGNSRIPEKYKDFDCTKVSFACKHKGTIIKPVDKATLYCYLPTKASWGLPFLMNTDMIPKGDRNDIETEVKLVNEEESNFNEELAAIAGGKLFNWIKDLLISRKYQLASVFSLVPDFNKCKKEHDFYDDFIERFEKKFDGCVEHEKIVPVLQGIANVKSVILDTTKLSTSGIMSDDEFLKFTGMDDYYLPLIILRNDKNFNSFLKRYAGEDQKFTKDNLKDLIANIDFQEWLKDQDNNNKFLNFLLKNDYLEDLLDEDIFLEDAGSLFKADELFYDIDKYLVDLQDFTNLIYFLSPRTRKFFEGNKEWENVINGAFAEFDCDEFVDDILLSRSNILDTKKKLNNKDTSIHFFKFLAENVAFIDNYSSLPFISVSDEVVNNFEDKFIFFESIMGHKVFDAEWLSSIEVEFISSEYTDKARKYFREYFGVQDFSDEVVVKQIILSDDYQETITTDINNDYGISKTFVDYCYTHQNLFKSGDLRSYSLSVCDKNGEYLCVLTEDHVFFQSDLYDVYASKEWLDADWMYVLDSDYYDGITKKADFNKFLNSVFGVEKLTEEIFYNHIVKPNLSQIIDNTSGQNDSDGKKNIDFVKYLDSNYRLIFEKEKDSDIFGNFVPVSINIADLSLNDNVYIYDEDLAEIMEYSWLPDDIVYLCNQEYGNSKALKAMGCKTYKFGEFYDDIIIEELDSINGKIDSKEDSISFHSFIIDHLGSLTTDQQKKMIDAKVYLYGNDCASVISSGHKILSSKAKELFDAGLVEFSDLDIIDPDYKIEDNTEYWEARLENSKFTVNHFFSWLKSNFETFNDTLQDEKQNLVFWRWLKDNVSDKLIEEALNMPVILKDGTIEIDGPIYFSDEYMIGAGIEHLVKIFDENAKFLSPKYIEEDDDIENWKEFFSKANIKHEIVDILVETVIPQLSEIEDDGLLKLLADNREYLENHYEDGLISQLTDLRVKAHDGEFYDISEAIYIDCEKKEPFPYITLPNQISFATADERRLIKDIIAELEGDCVKTLSEWQQRKLDCYLEMQEDNSDEIRNFHYQFINDLSAIRNNERNTLKELERIEEIQLLNKDDEFCYASMLTMGALYNPFFDFESCGIDSLDYVSDTYKTACCESVGRIFRDMKVHCDFQEEDIDILEDRNCAVYFWGTYLLKKDASISRVKRLISDKRFDDISCIPTKDYMKHPSDLYYGSEVSRYVRNIEDWENKVPMKDLPDVKFPDGTALFGELPFKKSLVFLDALYALKRIPSQDKRRKLLYWMIDNYVESYNSKILEYREDEQALWKNNKNESMHIKQLYALDYRDKTLEQFFGTNPRIVNKAYFPPEDSFKEACDILDIKTITSEDLKIEPVGDFVYTARDINHKLYALVIAGMTANEKWKELYDGYCQKLEDLVLHSCKSIMVIYKEDESINQSLKKFYHKAGENDFYFVDSLDGKRVFESFVEEYVKFLGIDTDDIAEDVIEEIMDSRDNALKIVKEQNTLMLDEEFKEELDKLIPGIKRELAGNEAEEEDEDDRESYRPSFTTKESSEDEEAECHNGTVDNDEEISIESKDEELADEEDFPDELEAPNHNEDDFISYRKEIIEYDGTTEEVVCEHYRSGTWVCGHYRDGYWVNGYWRGASYVSEHARNVSNGSQISNDTWEKSFSDTEETTRRERTVGSGSNIDDETRLTIPERTQQTSNNAKINSGNSREYSDMTGWNDNSRKYTPQKPKPFSPEDVSNFGSRGISRTLEMLEPTTSEVDEINRILGEELSSAQVADQNYLAQLRLYNNLIMKGYHPDESKNDFVRNADRKNEHTILGGKYIHKCSAAGGIMYLSPSIWSKIADDRCVVCVYLGAKTNEFMYFNSIDDILKWIGEDDIVIKLTGEEKADVVQELYSGVLDGVKGTAYTLIRINSNEKYNSVFAPLSNNDINNTEENEDEY